MPDHREHNVVLIYQPSGVKTNHQPMDYQPILQQLYQDFNDRHIEAVLAHMHTDVAWPNGWEGGYVTGHDEVRAYWLRQWQQIDPTVEPVSFKTRPDGQIEIRVHQVIKDMNEQVLSDEQLNHVYRFEKGKVRTMVIEY
jgi:SnoaL-like domain